MTASVKSNDREAERAHRPKAAGRAVARLAAVQALFQMEANGCSLEEVRADFADPSFLDANAVEGHQFAALDRKHFDLILSRAVDEQATIDQVTDAALVERWPIDRIDPTLRAVFRAAGAELRLGKVPVRVVINEFIDITRAFFPETPEPKFVNAVLDQMSKSFAQS